MTDDGLRRVLVAQSQPADPQFTCRFLKVLGGYAVNEASDGLGMIKALKNGPDVIIADTNQGAQFPRAIEIIKRNKALQETPIVIYSEEQKDAQPDQAPMTAIEIEAEAFAVMRADMEITIRKQVADTFSAIFK